MTREPVSVYRPDHVLLQARYREEFMSLARTLQETCYTPASHARWTMMLHAPAMRGVSRLKQRLEQRPAGAEVTRDRLRRLEERVADPFLIMEDAAKPQEPNGVITHGDFCGNNMLFHLGPDGQPDGTCLFDFQNSRQVALSKFTPPPFSGARRNLDVFPGTARRRWTCPSSCS